MKNLLNVIANLVMYYAAGWFLIYLVAILCGAPLSLSEWDVVARTACGIFAAPLIGGGIASYIEERY